MVSADDEVANAAVTDFYSDDCFTGVGLSNFDKFSCLLIVLN